MTYSQLASQQTFFGTEDVSDPDDTPEDVEDEEEPEFCEAKSQSVSQAVDPFQYD